MDRQKWLLLIVAVLVVLKLITGPLFARMDELRAEIELKNKRLERSESLEQERPRLTELNGELNSLLGELQSQYPLAEDPASTRLEIQAQIQSLALENGITISSLGWDIIRPGVPEQAFLTISFEGGFKEFVFYQVALEQQVNGLNIGELTFRVDNQSLRRNRLGTVKGDLIVEVSYLVSESDV